MKLLPHIALGLFAWVCLNACNQPASATSEDNDALAMPVAQSDEDWEILFDGSDLDKWRNYRSDELSEQWQIEGETLVLAEKGGGDIITKEPYKDFELQFEWKISECGNSGVFFHVKEADTLERVYHSGPEMQILDNTCHPDAKIAKHRAGDNYDLHAVSEETVRPAGEWNEVRLIVNQNQVEHWLNGTKVVSYELGSPEWTELYQNSKFKDMPMYGQAGKGHIALQDHGDKVWFRNIKIKRL